MFQDINFWNSREERSHVGKCGAPEALGRTIIGCFWGGVFVGGVCGGGFVGGGWVGGLWGV